MDSVQVKVGGTEHTLGAFKGYKAFAIGDVISDIGDAVPDLLERLAQFNREFSVNNAVHVTRGMTALPQFRGIFARMDMTDEDWERAGGTVTLPSAPDDDAVVMAMFPYVFREAKEHVVKLFSYMLCTNAELREADENESIDALLREKRSMLMHEADLDELVELAIASLNVVRGQFEGKVSELRTAATSLLGGTQASSQTKTASEPDESASQAADPSGDAQS